MKNRDEILKEKEDKAKADLAELAEQGAGFGAGFANGALKRLEVATKDKLERAEHEADNRTLEESAYNGSLGKGKASNFGFLILLILVAIAIGTSLINRIS